MRKQSCIFKALLNAIIFQLALLPFRGWGLNMYKETLSSGIVIVPMQQEYAEQLEALQRIVFPSLAEKELLHADQYKKHVGLFPEGQFVAIDGDKVIGATSSIRYHHNPDVYEHHNFFEIC